VSKTRRTVRRRPTRAVLHHGYVADGVTRGLKLDRFHRDGLLISVATAMGSQDAPAARSHAWLILDAAAIARVHALTAPEVSS
jgi:hypothetical protein